MSEEVKEGLKALEEAAKEPTLDEYLRRDPQGLSEEDLGKIVALERKRRALYIEASAKRKADKAEEAEEESNGEI